MCVGYMPKLCILLRDLRIHGFGYLQGVLEPIPSRYWRKAVYVELGLNVKYHFGIQIAHIIDTIFNINICDFIVLCATTFFFKGSLLICVYKNLFIQPSTSSFIFQ